MGRKSTSKGQGQIPPPSSPPPRQQSKAIIWIVAVIALVAVAVLFLRPGGETQTSAAETPASAAELDAQMDPAVVARAAELAKFGPREQANLPPIPFQGYAPPRPAEVITAAYEFAAEHPEILSYVPCYCGCENAGHKGNHDCFVKARDANGDVTEWDEHGVECTVCIDVANRSRQLYASGASVQDIRAAIEKEFAAHYPGNMKVPHPPAAHSH
jgi:hypothetical protein